MPGPLDFFTPGQWSDPNAPSIASTLDDPRARTALLQFGLSALAGPTWGDTGASQFARAVGSGGEAVGRQETQDIKKQEAESKEALREAQAGAATARAGAAATNVDLARQRLDTTRAVQDAITARSGLGRMVQLSNQYQMTQSRIRDHNRRIQGDVTLTDAQRRANLQPELPQFHDWLRQQGFDPNAMLTTAGGGLGAGNTGGPVEPPVGPTTNEPGGAGAGTYPTAPAVNQRQPNTVYIAPDGQPRRWISQGGRTGWDPNPVVGR